MYDFQHVDIISIHVYNIIVISYNDANTFKSTYLVFIRITVAHSRIY